MIGLFLKTSFLFIFSFSSFAYYYPPSYYQPYQPNYYSPYQYTNPYAQFCSYNQNSVCYTYTGRVCSLFVPNYHNNWFSGCLNNNYIYSCLNLPTFNYPWVQNSCYLRGTPCTCAFGTYNGYYIYEPGYVP